MLFSSSMASFSLASNLAGKSLASFCRSAMRASNFAWASLASACSFSRRDLATAWTYDWTDGVSKTPLVSRAAASKSSASTYSMRVWATFWASVA